MQWSSVNQWFMVPQGNLSFYTTSVIGRKLYTILILALHVLAMLRGPEFCINSRTAQKSTLFSSLRCAYYNLWSYFFASKPQTLAILMTSELLIHRWVITQLISQKQMLSYKYHLMLVPGVKKLNGWDVFLGQRYWSLWLLHRQTCLNCCVASLDIQNLTWFFMFLISHYVYSLDSYIWSTYSLWYIV
jgi:hypothetical protein